MNNRLETSEHDGLKMLREPFPAHQISKLPKESKAQADERKSNRDSAINCTVCGGWHHRRAVHLDYVGHAALTDRLLDTDVEWNWEPVAWTPDGRELLVNWSQEWWSTPLVTTPEQAYALGWRYIGLPLPAAQATALVRARDAIAALDADLAGQQDRVDGCPSGCRIEPQQNFCVDFHGD